ncbi:MAG: 30S ribosomal protein S6 [Minisyncoccia bacterium]
MAKKDIEVAADEILEDEGLDPRVYELGFHLDPELPTEEVKKAYQKVRDLIAENGTIVAEGEPQKIQLAYTISRQDVSGRRDFDSAFFSWIAYETVAPKHAEIIAAANANKHIIRFIDLLTTKDAARHATEMRALLLKVPEPEEDPEAVAGAELNTAIENLVV